MALFRNVEQISVWVLLSYTKELESQTADMALDYGVRIDPNGRLPI